jgi:hypothetical protein
MLAAEERQTEKSFLFETSLCNAMHTKVRCAPTMKLCVCVSRDPYTVYPVRPLGSFTVLLQCMHSITRRFYTVCKHKIQWFFRSLPHHD